MSYPILGMTAALWLMVAPLMGIETGFRAHLSLATGIVTLVLSVASIWRFSAGVAMAAVALLLAVVNLLAPASMGGLASYAFCAAALAIAGMSPRPTTMTAHAAGEHPVNTRLSHEPPALAA